MPLFKGRALKKYLVLTIYNLSQEKDLFIRC